MEQKPDGKLRITQVRSQIGQSQRHRGTLRALGLGKIGRTVEHEESPQLAGYAAEGPPPREGRASDCSRWPSELNLSNLKPAQARERPQARRPRPGLRQGPLLRPRDQGPEVALGLAQDARRLRGRPDAALHARRQAARRDVEGRDAGRAVPDVTQPRQRPRPRARFDAGAEVTPEALVEKGLIKNTRIDVKILGHGELTKKLTVTAHRVLREPRARRSRPPAAPSTALREPTSRRRSASASEGAAAAARPRRRRGAAEDEAAPRPRSGRRRRERGELGVLLARQRLARPGAPAAASSSPPVILALYRLGSWMPAPGVDSEHDQSYFIGQGGTRPRPAEPLLGRRAVAVLDLRARDHAVRHGVDHPAAPDGRRPEARAAPEGGRGRLRQDQPVHALPDRRARRRAVDRLRVPVQAPGRARRRTPAGSC